MRRVAVILGLLALLLPAAAWADGLDLTNQWGTVTITALGGIVSQGSELMSWGAITPAHGDLGQVSFSTGALTSGGIWTGGTWAGGGYFIVRGVGAWTKSLPGSPQGPVMLFNGSFVGPVIWTVQSITGKGRLNYIFTLSGAIQGMYYDGRTVNGTTTQHIYAFQNQWLQDHKGGISLGKSNLAVPEPGTLGLLGTGLIFVAGSLRRKLLGR
jgi:hypothetical protein